jgi:hypothetical protein
MALMDWFDLVAATGIDATRLSPMLVHIFAKKIMHDEIVYRRREKLAVNGVLRLGGSLRVVQEMTDAERDALRARVRL